MDLLFIKPDIFMKVLFVCRGNVGRSQIAAALFSKYSGSKAFSAGTVVSGKEGQALREIPLAEPVIRFMKEEGIDISNNTRTQLTPEMIERFDKIIVMAEPETVPEYLSRNKKKVEFWNIEDPKGMDDEGYRRIISRIKSRIKLLLKENV